jgi:hypothetical protein
MGGLVGSGRSVAPFGPRPLSAHPPPTSNNSNTPTNPQPQTGIFWLAGGVMGGAGGGGGGGTGVWVMGGGATAVASPWSGRVAWAGLAIVNSGGAGWGVGTAALSLPAKARRS